MKSWSLLKKLVVGFLFTGIAPLLVVFSVSTYLNKQELTKQAYNQLNISRDLLAKEIETLFSTVSKQVLVKSHEPTTAVSAQRYIDAYNAYYDEFTAANSISEEDMKASLISFYEDSFKVEYLKRTHGQNPGDLSALVNGMDKNTLALQYSYISNNKEVLGGKDALIELDDKTSWSQAHKEYHVSYREYLTEYNYYDIFIVDAKTGNIVYSVFKEIDFATSLLTGPYKDTNFAKAFTKALSSDGKSSSIVDLDFYYPSYEAPAGFVSNPIKNQNGETIAVLIYQIPVGKIDSILTADHDWNALGAGTSGETYIIGSDKKMRSVSRFFVEDFEGYKSALVGSGESEAFVDSIKARGNTALVQEVDSSALQSALAGKKAHEMTVDYRGENVLSSYKKLKLNGLDWYIFSEKDEAEVTESIVASLKVVVLLTGFICLLIALFSKVFATQISKKLIDASKMLKTSSGKAAEMGGDLVGQSQNLASASVQNAAATQESVASITEIGGMVRATQDRAEDSRKILGQVSENADEGVKLVQTMEHAMTEIESANQKLADFSKIIEDIGEKTNVINDIVFKTQLLSFNASIEAARAGQHGRGFSVVAEEVGSLAELSGNAATEISSLLGNSSNQVKSLIEYNTKVVQRGKDISSSVVDSFSEISSSMSGMKDNIEEIAQAANEQSIGIDEVNQAIKSLEESSQASSTASERFNILATESSGNAKEISSASDFIEEILNGGSGTSLLSSESISSAANDKTPINLQIDDEDIDGDDSSFGKSA